MKENQNIKDTLPEIFSALLDGFEKSRIEENPALFRYLKDTIVLDDFSTVELMVLHPVEELIESALKIKYPGIDSISLDIITNWDFFETHITKLVSSLEGFACSADKGSAILKKYINGQLNGTPPEFSAGREHYWEPKTGSVSDWMDLVRGLHRFRYGDPRDYLPAYKKLIETKAPEEVS